jgi:hypothetical protein
MSDFDSHEEVEKMIGILQRAARVEQECRRNGSSQQVDIEGIHTTIANAYLSQDRPEEALYHLHLAEAGLLEKDIEPSDLDSKLEVVQTLYEDCVEELAKVNG